MAGQPHAASLDDLPLEIGPVELAGLRQAGLEHALLDVRAPWEVRICGFAEALCIPLDSLGARLDELPRDRPLIVICHAGQRSLLAAQALRRAGFAQAASLLGGLDAWAELIDPTMARY